MCNILHAQVRQTINFNKDWKFYLGNDSLASNQNCNDASWRTLNLPHDWSIEGSFSKENPATTQGGALPGGIGWYRKTFTVPSSSQNKNISIEFDGVYRNSEVWINGNYLGKRPNGYISFNYDLTPYLKFGNEKNVIAVKVDNSQQPNSRWYSGSGIYRNVKLLMIKKWMTKPANFFVYSGLLKDNSTQIIAETQLFSKNKALEVWAEVYDSKGNFISRMDAPIINRDNYFQFSYKISNPFLWSPDNPNLYKVVFKVFVAATLVDEYETTFGIRSFNFDREKGFFLNNQPLKIKGVCMHHDLGALGTAFNYHAAERQLQILKDMGCNAIRTSHNPPAPEFLDLCDKMGFLVMDEAFDMWQKKKNKFDYAADFKQWHKQDLEDMILRDRNHPSVFMWSIGNEIREQFDSTGIALTKELVDIVKQLDPTRPVTSALTETDTLKNYIYQANALDVYGWNYNEQKYPDALKNYPGKIFIAAETTSALETRGQYDIIDTIRTWPPKGKKEMENLNGDWSVSAYDNVRSNWGSTHEATWKIIKKYNFLSGLFVWTGFDYLGEPTPFPWPARSSYFGIVDLAGFPKDVYYMYQSEWIQKPVLHILPHWNWEPGKIVDVWAYYNNADEVELFLNGKSLGIRKKINDDLHVMWRVPFEAGTLKAISRKNGKTVLTEQIKTAGAAFKIQLTADRKDLQTGSNDLSFITAKIVDKDGNLVPDANNLLEFSITGNATIAATDNGYQADTTSFTSTKRNAWKGMAMAIIRPSAKKGNSTLTVKAAGLLSATIALKIRD
ncbi:MAG: glycoside hydrolase family 2 TIM barrel-domain containing protein [Ferruginibacter sp.]